MKILVYLEQRDGKLKTSSLEALAVANGMAKDSSAIFGVIFGSKAAELAESAKGYGAGTIYTATDAGLDLYNPVTYTNAMQAAIDKSGADVVLGMASPMGRDFFPRVAARNDAGLLTDLIELNTSGGFTGGTKPMYAGKVRATVEFSGDGLKMATLRPNVFAANKTDASTTIESLDAVATFHAGFTTVELRTGSSDKADLTEATRIISGGRAMGNAENFQILNACADVLGATVGASRAAVDSGYAGHDMQVGQTGKTVNPQLYIACGISGSIQHMAGMRTSKVIVAINTDADAPIFTVADYGIVGDLFEAVPMLTKALQAKLS